MTTHTITHSPNLAFCLIDNTRQRWSVARDLIPMSDLTRLMLAQVKGEALSIDVTVEPQPVQGTCEFVEPDDREFMAMMRR
jgi:hypothetical protein